MASIGLGILQPLARGGPGIPVVEQLLLERDRRLTIAAATAMAKLSVDGRGWWLAVGAVSRDCLQVHSSVVCAAVRDCVPIGDPTGVGRSEALRWGFQRFNDAAAVQLQRTGSGYLVAQGSTLHSAVGGVARDLTWLDDAAALIVTSVLGSGGAEPEWRCPATGGRLVY